MVSHTSRNLEMTSVLRGFMSAASMYIQMASSTVPRNVVDEGCIDKELRFAREKPLLGFFRAAACAGPCQVGSRIVARAGARLAMRKPAPAPFGTPLRRIDRSREPVYRQASPLMLEYMRLRKLEDPPPKRRNSSRNLHERTENPEAFNHHQDPE